MNKIRCFILFLIFIFFIFFLISNAEDISYYEVSNNSECSAAAKNIAAVIDTDAIAVIFKGQSLLCGIISEKNVLSTSDAAYIKDIIKSYFPKIKKIRIESDNALARDIIELSYYSSGKIKKHILRSRFDFLLSQK